MLMFVYLFEIDAKLLGYVLFHYLRFLLLLLFRGGNTWHKKLTLHKPYIKLAGLCQFFLTQT